MADYENQNQPEYTEHPGTSSEQSWQNAPQQGWQSPPDQGWQNAPEQDRQNAPQNGGPYPPPYSNPGPYNQYPPYGNGYPPKPKNGFATASLVVGIFALLSLCCFAFPLSIIMGVGAVIFAVISKKGQPMYGTAIAGMILGIIAVVLGIGEFIYFMALSTLVKDPANAAIINEFMEQLEQQLQQAK